jgi:6,7-dimethyl-8-ribityllumazine synthase
MATFLEGIPTLTTGRYAVVVARFNSDITEALLDGCLHAFQRAGLPAEAIDVARVPGAFELPLACERLAASGRYQAIIALGCVIRGGTPHFDYVCSETCRGVMDVNLKHHLPVVLGVLTCDTLEQALYRADRAVLTSSNQADPHRTSKITPRSNKGAEAAEAALEMVSLLGKI